MKKNFLSYIFFKSKMAFACFFNDYSEISVHPQSNIGKICWILRIQGFEEEFELLLWCGLKKSRRIYLRFALAVMATQYFPDSLSEIRDSDNKNKMIRKLIGKTILALYEPWKRNTSRVWSSNLPF